jgi:glycopeptide antibiotics resistance protein
MSGEATQITRFGRRFYTLATLAFALLAIYGSLVPLDFKPRPLGQALEAFTVILSSPFSLDSRADFVTNILLFVPLGYLWLGALQTDRRGWLRRLASAASVIVCCAALSVTVEFTQIFFVGRTTALSDMVGETLGSIVGVVLWLIVGDTVTGWARDFFIQRERTAVVERLLLAYSVVFIVSQLLPLDLTINLGDLAHKYRRGGIVLVPFGYVYGSLFDRLWDYFGDITLNAPLGAAAVLVWADGRRRRFTPALAIGIALVASIEFAQVFVESRIADVTDIITGSIGIAIGVWLATYMSVRMPTSRDQSVSRARVAVMARVGLAVWMAALLSYHWHPFDFTLDPDRVIRGMHELRSPPFSSYYIGSEFHAFTEMARKSLLAFPLGVLLRLAWPDRKRGGSADLLRTAVAVLGGFLVLLAVEVGQVFLPTRVPDVTDAIVGEMGLLAGFWVAGRLVSAVRHEGHQGVPLASTRA